MTVSICFISFSKISLFSVRALLFWIAQFVGLGITESNRKVNESFVSLFQDMVTTFFVESVG